MRLHALEVPNWGGMWFYKNWVDPQSSIIDVLIKGRNFRCESKYTYVRSCEEIQDEWGWQQARDQSLPQTAGLHTRWSVLCGLGSQIQNNKCLSFGPLHLWFIWLQWIYLGSKCGFKVFACSIDTYRFARQSFPSDFQMSEPSLSITVDEQFSSDYFVLFLWPERTDLAQVLLQNP